MIKVQDKMKGFVAHGLSACAGCGMELIIRNLLDVMGEDTTLVIPPGCSALFCGYGNETTLKIPAFQGNLENSAAIATGIKAGFQAQGNEDTHVVAFAGDGATLDIGLQSLSGMMERGDDVLYVCYDNEAYMNTGIQSSSSTPISAWTTTTPGGKSVNKKDLLKIAIAHNIPYCASASVANINDMRKKFEKAKNIKGPRLLHIYCPCPTGWGFHSSKSIEVSKLAVQTGAWVLYEYENGKIEVTQKVKELKPLKEYFKMQKRFKGASEDDIKQYESYIVEQYEKLINC